MKQYARRIATTVTHRGEVRMVSFQLYTEDYETISDMAKRLNMPTGAVARRIMLLGMRNKKVMTPKTLLETQDG